MTTRSIPAFLLTLAVLLIHALPGEAQTVAPGSAAPPTERLDALEKRLATLEVREQLLRDSVERLANRPTVSAGASGFALVSADQRFRLRLRGYVQSDARFALDDAPPQATASFLMRRVRPVLEATVFDRLDVRLMPDFAGGSTALLDAYVEVRFAPALALRSGKFKPPVGLERLQSATDLAFVERGHPTSLAPNRDAGVQLAGEFAGGTVSYAAGLFNGVPDLGVGESDNSGGKDAIGRVFVRPFHRRGPGAVRALGIGVALSSGTHRGSAGTPFLGAYRTPAQRPMFAYRADGTAAGTARADGDHLRQSLHGVWNHGPVGLAVEGTRSRQTIRLDDIVRPIDARAWQGTMTVALTGETATQRALVPRNPFNPARGHWGGLELAGRVSELEIDDAAFPVFADPSAAVRRARTYGVGLNWSLVPGVRLMADYVETHFRGGSGTGDRPAERTIMTRFQHSF
jgi:phosphate-selective porin OprO/OprP